MTNYVSHNIYCDAFIKIMDFFLEGMDFPFLVP